MKYYKIVKRITSISTKGVRLFSLMHTYLPRQLEIEYRPRIWVSGKLGPLFIFCNVADAKGFRAAFSTYTELEIWEVEAENPREQTTILSVDLLVGWAREGILKRKIKLFFEQEGTAGFPFNAPIGTMVADKVKLVRRVSK